MDFALFLSSSELADEVAEYEIWRLAVDAATDLPLLVEQVAYRTGQLSRVTSLSSKHILRSLGESLAQRMSGDSSGQQQQLPQKLDAEFRKGRHEPFMDRYHVTRERWLQLARE